MDTKDRNRVRKVTSSFVDPHQRIKAMNTRRLTRARLRRLNTVSPAKAIRQYCLTCTERSTAAVKNCGVASCPMWPYRFGRNPIESDLRVPIRDDRGNVVEYREYRTYPLEVGDEALRVEGRMTVESP